MKAVRRRIVSKLRDEGITAYDDPIMRVLLSCGHTKLIIDKGDGHNWAMCRECPPYEPKRRGPNRGHQKRPNPATKDGRLYELNQMLDEVRDAQSTQPDYYRSIASQIEQELLAKVAIVKLMDTP